MSDEDKDKRQDDPCDDWSNHPIPKPSTDSPKRVSKRLTWWH